jgi:hypothetical protein
MSQEAGLCQNCRLAAEMCGDQSQLSTHIPIYQYTHTCPQAYTSRQTEGGKGGTNVIPLKWEPPAGVKPGGFIKHPILICSRNAKKLKGLKSILFYIPGSPHRSGSGIGSFIIKKPMEESFRLTF